MTAERIDIFKRVRKLNFPLGKYVVVGGAMEAHGLRNARDVDVVVMPDLYDQLKANGWKVCDCEQCQTSGRVLLKAEGVDVLPDYSCGDLYRADTQQLIAEADIIEGLPFVKLTELLKWKKAANRPKDQTDVEIIEKYLLVK